MNSPIQTSLENAILRITVNRPDAMNALNNETFEALIAQVKEINHNEAIRGVIITGTGKAFIAGADIKELQGLDATTALALARRGQKVFKDIESCSKPIVAAINGYALGGGCELAMACHMRIAVKSAKLGQPEVNLGLIPGYGGTQRMAQLVGRGKALELLLTGDMINADEALRIGLVNHVLENTDELLPFVETLLGRIIHKGQVATSKIIESVNAGFSFAEKGYETELRNFSLCAETSDFSEGLTAFVEKRQPVFSGK